MTAMALCGTGWTSWDEFRRIAQEWQAVWVDLEGAHLAAVPESPPDCTHLWAWTGEVWARARLDEGDVVAGFLHPDGACPRSLGDCRRVAVAEPRMVQTWQEEHIRADAFREHRWSMLETIEGVATTFVRSA